jgi:hypothetical protein
MPNCKEVAGILASGALEDSVWTRRLSVRFHLLMCRHCRRYAAQLRAMGAAAGKIFGSGAPAENPDVLRRLENAILDSCPDDTKPPPAEP